MKRHFSLKQEVRSIVDSAVAKAQFDLKKYIDKQLDAKFHDIADAIDLAETKLYNKQSNPNELDLSMYDVSNEWLPYETANSNESELSAEEQLLNEQKNQIDLGTISFEAPEPGKAYPECVILELQSKIDELNHELEKVYHDIDRWHELARVEIEKLNNAIKADITDPEGLTPADWKDVADGLQNCIDELKEKLAIAETECNKQKQRADLAECKFWDAEAMTTSTDEANNSPTGIELLKAARNVLREIEVNDFVVSRKYTDESYDCPKTIGSLVCDIDWYLDDIKDVVQSNKVKQSEDSYLSETFLKQCNELRAENNKLKEQLEIANRKNEKLVQLMQATPVTGNADRAVTAQPTKKDIIELTVQDILKKHQPKPADYGYVLFGEDNFNVRIFDTQLLPIISALYDELENRYVNYSTTYTDLVKHVCTHLEKNDVIFVDRYYIVRV